MTFEDQVDGSSDRRATLVYIEQTIIDSQGHTYNYKVGRYKSDAGVGDRPSEDAYDSLSGAAPESHSMRQTKEKLLILYDEVVDDQHPIQWPPGHGIILDMLKVCYNPRCISGSPWSKDNRLSVVPAV